MQALKKITPLQRNDCRMATLTLRAAQIGCNRNHGESQHTESEREGNVASGTHTYGSARKMEKLQREQRVELTGMYQLGHRENSPSQSRTFRECKE